MPGTYVPNGYDLGQLTLNGVQVTATNADYTAGVLVIELWGS